MNMKTIASKLGISRTSVYKHKEYLMKNSIIKARVGTWLYDRGDNAKFIESREVQRGVTLGGLHPGVNPHATTVEETFKSALEGYTPGGPSHKIVIDTARAHMKGSIKFIVEKVGDHKEFTYRNDIEKITKIIPFLNESPYNTQGGSKFLGKLKLPDKPWTVTVQYQTTKRKDYFYVWPPQVDLTTEELESDNADRYPQQFFSKDVQDILYFLERWAGWKFQRNKSGEISGDYTGQVEYGYTNPQINRTVPEGLRGFVDVPQGHIDKSPGETEIEHYQAKNTKAIMKAGETFDKIEDELSRLDDELKKKQLELKRLDIEFAEKEIEVKQRLSRLISAVGDVVKYEEMEKVAKELDTHVSEKKPLPPPPKDDGGQGYA